LILFFRLEDDAFNEPAQTYYTLEIKAIKLKRDSLIKVTHQVIFKINKCTVCSESDLFLTKSFYLSGLQLK
jgi:hypothetical protein